MWHYYASPVAGVPGEWVAQRVQDEQSARRAASNKKKKATNKVAAS